MLSHRNHGARKLNIVIAASEAVPFAKTGGLADFCGALFKVLARLGHTARLVMPAYRSIKQFTFLLRDAAFPLEVPWDGRTVTASVQEVGLPNVSGSCFLINYDPFFDRDGLYREAGANYEDNGLRFAFLSRACLELARLQEWKVDVFHCNDWQTALLPVYLRTVYADDPRLAEAATVLTIHNIAFQGLFPVETLERAGLPHDLYRPDLMEYWERVNFLKGGLVFADKLTTISETYAREIRETEEFGMGLQGVLHLRRRDLEGIVNGVDEALWNPATDPFISPNFTLDTLDKKKLVKLALLRETKLAEDADVPLLGMVSRLEDQKGIDILIDAIPGILKHKCAMVILGMGDPGFQEVLLGLQYKYPKRLSVILKFDNELAHRIYAGSDIFLMPSRFEPCGQGQLISQKYGTVPVVRRTGGLADTVRDVTRNTESGTGYVFDDYAPGAFLEAVKRALKGYALKKWHVLMQRCMQSDFSWDYTGQQFVSLYGHALAHPRRHPMASLDKIDLTP